MRGEVTRQFVHAITGDDVLLVDFEGVIGVRSVSKSMCLQEGFDGAGPSEPTQREAVEGRLCASGMKTTRQQLLAQFERTEDVVEGLIQFLVGGDLELPPLLPPAELVADTQEPVVGVTFPDYLLPIEGSSLATIAVEMMMWTIQTGMPSMLILPATPMVLTPTGSSMNLTSLMRWVPSRMCS